MNYKLFKFRHDTHFADIKVATSSLAAVQVLSYLILIELRIEIFLLFQFSIMRLLFGSFPLKSLVF